MAFRTINNTRTEVLDRQATLQTCQASLIYRQRNRTCFDLFDYSNGSKIFPWNEKFVVDPLADLQHFYNVMTSFYHQ